MIGGIQYPTSTLGHELPIQIVFRMRHVLRGFVNTRGHQDTHRRMHEARNRPDHSSSDMHHLRSTLIGPGGSARTIRNTRHHPHPHHCHHSRHTTPCLVRTSLRIGNNSSSTAQGLDRTPTVRTFVRPSLIDMQDVQAFHGSSSHFDIQVAGGAFDPRWASRASE